MHKFWDFIWNDAGERVLRLEGPIDEDDLWGDAVTPEMFRDELEAEDGDVTVWLNSPGGNVFAADQIYNMLLSHKGKITVKIDAVAASAASVIAMAGDTVLISPVGMLMIHDPMTIAMGNTKDMEAAIKTLNEVKESIINAYQRKTGLSRNKIAQLMSDETWLNARKAKEMGFADDILFGKEADKETDGEKEEAVTVENTWQPFHAKLMGQAIWAGLTRCAAEDTAGADGISEKASGEAQDAESPETGVSDKPAAKKPEEGTQDKPEKEDPEESEPDSGGDPDGDTPDEDSPGEEDSPGREDSPEEEKDNPDDPKKKKPEDAVPEMPVIGMDGKTKDGAVPYEILKKQLDFLK